MIQKTQVWVAVAALFFLISLPVSAQPGAGNGSPLELWRSVLTYFTGGIVDFVDGSSEVTAADVDTPSQQPTVEGAEAGPYIEPGG